MTPTTAAVIAVSGAVNRSCPCVDSTSGPPARMNRNDRQEGEERGADGAGDSRQRERVGTEQRARPAADETDEGPRP